MRTFAAAVILVTLALLALSGCTGDTTPHLLFNTHLVINDQGETVITGEIRNAGYGTLRTLPDWQGVLEVRDEAGAVVASAVASGLVDPLPPGESALPAGWKGRLAPGTYQLTWEAPGYGKVQSDFTIIERQGRLHVEPGPSQQG